MRATTEWVRDSIRSAAWAPVAVFVLHLVFSRVLGWYLTVPGLDMPMHFLGGVAIAYFFARSIRLESASPVLGALTTLGRCVLTIALVGLATVVWELAEWTTDSLELTRAQVGLDDTVLDMLLGLLGGVAFLLVSSRARTGLDATARDPSSRVALRREPRQTGRASTDPGSERRPE